MGERVKFLAYSLFYVTFYVTIGRVSQSNILIEVILILFILEFIINETPYSELFCKKTLT